MKKLNTKKLAVALYDKRLAAKLTREKASKLIGISTATLGRLEHYQLRKSTLPDLDVYYKCCQWLGVEMETFFEN